MKTFKLIALSSILATNIGTVLAATSTTPTNSPPHNPNLNFPGFSISSNQYLAVNLGLVSNSNSNSSSTTSTTTTSTSTCYVNIQVNGVAVNSSALTVTSQTPVFYIAATGPTATTPAAQPEYFQVNVVSDTTVTTNNCAGLLATLAVHNSVSQDLQTVVPPMPPMPPLPPTGSSTTGNSNTSSSNTPSYGFSFPNIMPNKHH